MVADGSITKNLKTYEKMLSNPAFRKRSHMKQPTPNASDLHGVAGGKVDTSNLGEEKQEKDRAFDISPEEQDWLSEVDRRMEMRKSGQLPPRADERAHANAGADARIEKMEKQIQELQETVAIIMKAQMKLITEKN